MRISGCAGISILRWIENRSWWRGFVKAGDLWPASCLSHGKGIAGGAVDFVLGIECGGFGEIGGGFGAAAGGFEQDAEGVMGFGAVRIGGEGRAEVGFGLSEFATGEKELAEAETGIHEIGTTL